MTKESVSAAGIRVFADYWSESSRPLASLLFVAPMLLAYEAGLFLLGSRAMRNGADVWLRRFLEDMGFSQYFLLPALICAILLGWHHLNRESWKVHWTVPYGMFVECVVLSVGLLILGYCQIELMGFGMGSRMLALPGELPSYGRFLAYLGAGIYEELLFRLMLIPMIAGVCRAAGASRVTSLVGAVAIASLMFAAAHYRLGFTIGVFHLGTTVGEPFEWLSFLFRVLAGVFFSLLFVYRGFGVAAGSHALYDILVSPW